MMFSATYIFQAENLPNVRKAKLNKVFNKNAKNVWNMLFNVCFTSTDYFLGKKED